MREVNLVYLVKKMNEYKFTILVISNLVIGISGWGISQLPFIKNVALMEFLSTCAFTVFIGIVNYLIAFLASIISQLISKEIDVSQLEDISRNSDKILYVSSLPRFSDWFKPELIKYLVSTSPLYYNKSGRDLATRIFVVNKKDKYRPIKGYFENICREKLVSIHEHLGIKALAIDVDDTLQIMKAIDGRKSEYVCDFCIGFKKQISFTKPYEAFILALPNHQQFGDVFAFEPYTPGGEEFKFYTVLANDLLTSNKLRSL